MTAQDATGAAWRQFKVTPSMIRELRNLMAGRPFGYNLPRGIIATGNALKKRGWMTADFKITEAGRAAWVALGEAGAVPDEELVAEAAANGDRPRPYLLWDPGDLARLLRETAGYARVSLHYQEGTDMEGRRHACEALERAVSLGFRLVPPP